MQDMLPSNLRKNFSDLALLAMQHDRLAFQNSFFYRYLKETKEETPETHP